MNELARWDPFKSVVPFGESLFDVVPSLLRPVTRTSAWTGARMEVAENEKSYQLAIELPGIPKDSIQVSVYENDREHHRRSGRAAGRERPQLAAA